MEYELEVAKTNTILSMPFGSHLYGVDTPESDTDRVGVFMPNRDIVLGIVPTFKKSFGYDSVEEADFSVVVKDAEGRNTSEATDVKLHELRKFMSLAAQSSPQMLEMLFGGRPGSQGVVSSSAWERVYNERYLFPAKASADRFYGYACSQMRRMQIRTTNYSALRTAADVLGEIAEAGQAAQNLLLIQVLDKLGRAAEEKGGHIVIGDLNFQKHIRVKKALAKTQNRLSKATHRSRLMDRYGFDTKFGSHVIRLLHEGIEILTTGELTFPLKDRDEILDIKQGNWNMEEVLERADDLIATLIEAETTTMLPDEPDLERINRLTVDILFDHLTKLSNPQ